MIPNIKCGGHATQYASGRIVARSMSEIQLYMPTELWITGSEDERACCVRKALCYGVSAPLHSRLSISHNAPGHLLRFH